MEIRRWNPSQEYTKLEELLMNRLKRHKKLFGFLRRHRLELFDDKFQDELVAMYRDTGAGKEPVTPAVMAMAVLLQSYSNASDAAAVELTVVDLRWQIVLGTLGDTKPAFSQGAFWDFRERLIAHDMDRRLLERTRELARETKEFDWKKIPKELHVAMDSSPLEGAGRVEDTLNLLGHAARNIVTCVALMLGLPFAEVAAQAGIPLLNASSIKAGLDMSWDNPGAKKEALNELVAQLDSLQVWVEQNLQPMAKPDTLEAHLKTLAQIREQDLEPDPENSDRMKIREGTAKERRISIEDSEMRHGRKSKKQRFDGFKRHLAVDLDTALIVACAVTAGNRPDHEAAAGLKNDIEDQGLQIDGLHTDRGYIASPIVDDIDQIFCRPWSARNDNDLFTKSDFKLNMRDKTITCPAGQTRPIQLGKTTTFDPDICDTCKLRSQCTKAKAGRGRSVQIAKNEKLQQRLRKRIKTAHGRAQLRRRIVVEHKLAHVSQRQGNRARYRGKRRNLFDLYRASAIQNLELIQRTTEAARKAA